MGQQIEFALRQSMHRVLVVLVSFLPGLLAFHLRSLNRGHLLGAFTPLYLAWVASTLATVTDDASAAAHREETAVAFEREKPYLVARWRWPDRFNP